MQTSAEILADLWTLAGGEGDALSRVTLTGEEPALPSSFRVGAAAQVSIAAAGLAASEIMRLRTGLGSVLINGLSGFAGRDSRFWEELGSWRGTTFLKLNGG